MGQAKRRGTFEQRKEKAMEKRQVEFTNQRRLREERQRIEDHEADMREAAMTPEEKDRRKRSHIGMVAYMAMMGSMLGYRTK